MPSADGVVIGAGVIGASVAFHLARAGMSVIVIDRAAGPGEGSTGRATGGFRAQFGTAINIQLSLLSRQKLRSFEEETGVDPAFVPVGYLFLAGSASDLAVLRDAHALQQREGVTSTIVDDADIAKLNPHVSREGIVGGAWSADDGVMRPLEILRGYREAAERAGVVFRWNEAPRAIDDATVTTDKEVYASRLVVNAAGAWAAEVARVAGVTLPVTPLRRHVALTEPTNALPARFPMTIWTSDGFHLRVRDDRVLLLRPTAEGFFEEITKATAERVPLLRNVAIDRDRSWDGFYEMSPDHHVILGPAPGRPNLLLANGSSGHGVMHAPAIGQLISEIATERATAIDIRGLRPSRFDEGDPVRGPTLL